MALTYTRSPRSDAKWKQGPDHAVHLVYSLGIGQAALATHPMKGDLVGTPLGTD